MKNKSNYLNTVDFVTSTLINCIYYYDFTSHSDNCEGGGARFVHRSNQY